MVETAEPRDWWKIALVTVPAIMLLGSASGWLSNSGYGNAWFDVLAKPDAMPPGWVFGAAWTLLYVLLGIALALAWAAPPSSARSTGLGLFFAQLALNFAWSPIFFAWHQVGLALGTILAMFALSVGAAAAFARVRPLAAWLMLPYLGWLCFASALTTASWWTTRMPKRLHRRRSAPISRSTDAL